MQIGSSVDIHAVWKEFVGNSVLIHRVRVCCLGGGGGVLLAIECHGRVSHMHTQSAEDLTVIAVITVPTGECSATCNL